MATAEELLRGTSEGTVDKTLYVDFDTRTIAIPPSIHQLGVESDDDVKKLTFSVPRHYYDCDLSTFKIFINYMNAKKEGDVFEVVENNLRVTEDTIEFDWIVGRNALAYKGTAIFNVCMKKGSMQPDPEDETQEIFVVDQELNTTVAKLPVLEGLETSEGVIQEYADILMQWEEQLFGIENSAKSNIIQKGSEVIEAVNTAGEEQKAAIASKGSEVINTVGEQLDIKIPEYITANPDQFKGDKGDTGQDGISPTLSENKVGKVTTVTVTDGNGTHTFEVNDGADGKDGQDGTSVTILGSYSTEAELIAAHPTGNKGDSYLVEGDLYVWDIITSAWKNVGTIQGPAGTNGKDGVNGTDGIDGVSPTVEISKTGKVTTITITDSTGSHVATINDGVDGTGSGDMSMATYDTDGNGIVDDSEKLGGVAANQYALKTDIPNKAADSDKLGGVAANQYALKTDITTPSMSATDDGNGNVTLSIGG